MRNRTKHLGIVMFAALIGLLAGPLPSGNIARAQTDPPGAAARSTNGASKSSDPSVAAGSSTVLAPAAEPPQTGVEASLYDSLYMAGKTQNYFSPLTPGKRAKLYAEDLLSPFHLMMAGASAGVAQLDDVPHEWGQGALGYGRRYANYYGYAATSSMIQMAGEDLLHEDDLYYGSGEGGMWRRVKYAVASTFLARSADGARHLSASQIGGVAGGAFISRLWQPSSNDSAGDGATSFAITLAKNAGVNVLREFLPDFTRRIFHRGEQPIATGATR